MTGLNNKKILVCVSGGASAHQMPELLAVLKAQGAELSVLAAPDAADWVSLKLLAQLTGTAVRLHSQGEPFGETRLVQVGGQPSEVAQAWLDELLGNLSNEPSDTTLFLADPSAVERFPSIDQLGPVVLPTETGLPLPRFDIETILAFIEKSLTPPILADRRVLVTAGPTYEDIDPVRFVGNRSSGKMGYAVAAAAWRAGAQVTLISGPVALSPPTGVALIKVRSAEQMLSAVETIIGEQEIYISCAAVADYRPAQSAPDKIKKGADQMVLSMIANPDILRRVASRPASPFCVGFAAETVRVEEYARGKLASKNLQLIAANEVGGETGGFESDQNRLELFWPGGRKLLGWSSKREQAQQLIAVVAELFAARD